MSIVNGYSYKLEKLVIDNKIKYQDKQPDILTMARKKRHIHLLEKIQKGKSLSSRELRELEKFEGTPLPPGVVKTQEEVAKAFHVSTRTVQYWIRDGIPRTKKGFYNLIEIQAWRKVKKQQRKSKKIIGKEEWDAKYRKYKAQLAEVELKKAYGQVVSRKEVEKGQVARILVVKRALLSLPKVIAPVIGGMEPREIQVYLTAKIKEIIDEFAKKD